MPTAIQIHAPNGWGVFQKGRRYYFAGDRLDGNVLVVWFAMSKGVRRAYTLLPLRQDIEAALLGDSPKLKRLEVQHSLPEWLMQVEAIDFEAIEEKRYKEKSQTYREQAEKRVLKIAPALDHANEILNSPNPLAAIARVLRAAGIAEHPHRLQVWYFAYQLHGQDFWALKQPTHMSGTWDRNVEHHKDKKFGRHSLSGSCYGWPSSQMHDQIIASYLARCEEGVTMASIHVGALIEDFGCVPTEVDGVFTYVHPQNKPFPSYGQFRHVVVREFGLHAVQKTLYGAARVRLKAACDEGNYTEQYANILEGFEVDAYYTERPSSMQAEAPADPIAVARGICVATGAVVGVGFSLGSETGEAYRSMLFCMCVPKSYVARLYGIPAEDFKWIMEALPGNFTSDRGPGGQRKLAERLQEQFPIKSIAPSYGAQSKAPVESSHPRSVQLEGAPSYMVSALTIPQMMKRELYRANRDNHSSNISARLCDETIHEFRKEGRVATPHHYWEFLEARLRTSARTLSLEKAVRAFWTPTDLVVDKNGVKYRHRYYTSDEFKDSGIRQQLVANSSIPTKAYVLSLVTRYVWVEIKGRLIEVEATRRVRHDSQDLFVPLSHLERTADELAKLNSATRLSAQAANGKAEKDFAANTGKGWHDGERKSGRPTRASGTAAHEGIIAKGHKKPRKVA